jgi:murein DD-endopeptidase MepM/ murein hydrolase activator NlpD
MKSLNIYSHPLDDENITGMVIGESESHKIYKDKHGATFDDRNSIDLDCPEGSPVKAALKGTVVYVSDGMTDNWEKKEKPPEDFMTEDDYGGNEVLILHENEEVTRYSHLQNGSINVKKGDVLTTVYEFAKSGNTGCSTEPHLHFAVMKFTKPLPAYDYETLEPQWDRPLPEIEK